jgi:pyruvate,water dikinase
MKKSIETVLPHACDEAGNLLWIGGSADQPWIVTTQFTGILNKHWVGGKSAKQADLYRKFNAIGIEQTPIIAEKVAKIKELGARVENQFVVTDFAYQAFIAPMLPELRKHLDRSVLDVKNNESFSAAETACQGLLLQTEFNSEFIEAVEIAYEWLDSINLGAPRAIRSTAPSEDGGEFSGSGKYSTELKQYGFDAVLKSIKKCFVSRFNRGALHYQFTAPHAFGEDLASLSFAVMVQDMDPAIDVAGTVFTADTQSNHRGFVEINFTYGLGEAVVSGRVSSDSWMYAKRPLRIYKDGLISFRMGEKQEKYDGKWHLNAADDRARKCMNDGMAEKVAKVFLLLGDIFREIDPDSHESDFEAAVNLDMESIIVTQQRAITTLKSVPIHKKFELKGLSVDGEETDRLRNVTLLKHQGINAGIPGIVHGVVISLFGEGAEFKSTFEKVFNAKRAEVADKYGDSVGVILVTSMTYPWMEPSMEQTVACITTRGGKNDHTPIWCKEHGLPCAVSVKEATKLPDGKMITYYGVGESPIFYSGRQEFTLTETKLEGLNPSPIPIRMIMSDAHTARLVCMQSYFPALNIGMGSGLVRWEMIASKLRVHPMAVVRYETLEQDFINLVQQGRMTHDEAVRTAKDVAEFIRSESKGYDSPIDWYVKSLARELAGIVSPYYTDDINQPMVIRLADFKTNEHADLLGGRAYEPVEENPMLGDRGAGKYLGPYQVAFLRMDLVALSYVINEMGYTNIHIEVPFVRTPGEMAEVCALVKNAGIDIPLDMMYELPVNISRAVDFFQVADGGQIGSNDLLQLEFGLDRSGGAITRWHVDHLKFRIGKLISRRDKHAPNFHLGLCGNLPSTDPSFAKWLAESGINEFSVTPDALIPALLGVTGDSPDGKITKTTIKSDGSVWVNGQQVVEAVTC